MRKILLILILIFSLSINAFAAPSYGKTGESGYFDGDVGVSSGNAYYVNGLLFDAANTVYPQDYATGTGTSEDPWAGDCVEDAYTACPTGGTIYLRTGYYALASSLSIDKTVNIIGEGIGKTFIVTADATGFNITANYVILQGFTIDGDEQTDNNSSLRIINASNTDYIIMRDLEVKNAGYYGINNFESNYGTYQNIYVHDNYRHGLHMGADTAGRNIYNVYRDIYAWNQGNTGFSDRGADTPVSYPIEESHNVYDNIHTWGNTNYGIAISAQSGGILSNSSVSGTANKGLVLNNLHNFDIHDCLLTLCAGDGMYMATTCGDIRFTNVIAKNNLFGFHLNGADGVKFDSCEAYDSRTVTSDDIAFVDGGGGEDTITMTSAMFLKSGFLAGKDITITGAGEEGNNSTFEIVSVVAGTINVATGSLTAEAAGEDVTITLEKVQSYGLLTEGTTDNIELVNCDFEGNKTGNIANNASATIISNSMVSGNVRMGDGLWTNYIQITGAGALTTVGTASITSDVTGDLTGNASGSSGSCTGLAATATALATARAIGGINFDGTAAITPRDSTHDHALGSDEDYSGILDSAPVGETVAVGDLLYYDWTAVEWKKAKADAVGTTPAMRIALATGNDGDTVLMLVQGYIRDDNAFDFGAARIYLNDDTAGTCDDTAPAESGDMIQLVGIGITADILYFCPSIDVGEI